jgi:hypothetical protein
VDTPITAGGNRLASVGFVPGTSAGTVVTAGGTAHALGAYVPLSAATPCAASGITLTINMPTTLVGTYLINVGVGASGSEQIIIPNLLVSSGILDIPVVVHFPIKIPAGVRLAAQMRCSTAASTVTIAAVLHTAATGAPVGLQRAVAYGAVTATSRGTLIDAGATANTKPSTWTTLIATTTESCRGLIIGLGNSIDISRGTAHWLIDVGIGAAASERALVGDYYARASVNETVLPGLSPVFPVSIPAGSRISARCQSNNITSGDRALDIVAYGLV